MNSKDVYNVMKELVNKVKVSCVCNIENVGLADFFKKSKWGIEMNNDELTGDLDLKINIQLQEKEVATTKQSTKE